MPDDPLHQPHDKLFRATFSDPRNAAAFLRHHLGGGAASCMDRASLALLPCSFIKDQMKEFEADLLFLVKIGPSNALVYILWEHQRSEDPTMALRLLTYMVRIWDDQLKKQGRPARLPLSCRWCCPGTKTAGRLPPGFRICYTGACSFGEPLYFQKCWMSARYSGSPRIILKGNVRASAMVT